jgi:hypothetical protein
MQASTSGRALASTPVRLWSAAQPRTPACPVCAARRRPSRAVLGAAAAAANNATGFAEGAQRLASDASERVKQFVKENRLDEKATEAGQEAGRRLSEGWGEAQVRGLGAGVFALVPSPRCNALGSVRSSGLRMAVGVTSHSQPSRRRQGG